MQRQISSELQAHLYLKSRLREDFPDIDEETLIDTLEGISNLHECLAALVRSRADDEALLTGLKSRLDDMKARFARLQDRVDQKRLLLCDVMERAELARLTLPDFTVSLRKSPPSTEIIDEEMIPEEFWKAQPPKLDRQAISERLRAGCFVAGVKLGEPQSCVAIRSR